MITTPSRVLAYLAVGLVVIGGLWYLFGANVATIDDTVQNPIEATTTPGEVKPPVACTQEAKICPDGSAVGRTGPNCEFAACPTTGILQYKSGVRGTVTLGPTCPVMRDPPDPLCADKPYATTIEVSRNNSEMKSPFVVGKSDANGIFHISLPPGSYTLYASGGKVLPRCSPVEAVVVATGYVTVNISCDTGIR